MSSAHVYMIRTLLKAFGVDATELENKIQDAQKIVLEFDLEQLRAAMQMILDYRANQAQLDSRIIAIMNHFSIADPVLLAQLEKGNDDGN